MAFTRCSAVSLSMAMALTLLATSLILSSATFINPFCVTADDKALCTSMAKDAKTWEGAMTNVLKATLEKAKAIKPIVDGIGSNLPLDLKPQSKESMDSTCNEIYENIIDNVKSSMRFVKNDPQSSLKVYLSAISFSPCKDGLDEFGVSSTTEVDHVSYEMQKLSSTLLAVADVAGTVCLVGISPELSNDDQTGTKSSVSASRSRSTFDSSFQMARRRRGRLLTPAVFQRPKQNLAIYISKRSSRDEDSKYVLRSNFQRLDRR